MYDSLSLVFFTTKYDSLRTASFSPQSRVVNLVANEFDSYYLAHQQKHRTMDPLRSLLPRTRFRVLSICW